jgi:hypothetical protein
MDANVSGIDVAFANANVAISYVSRVEVQE